MTTRDHFLLASPFWLEDARERLRVMLPELMVSIVVATCQSAFLIFQDGDNIAATIATAGVVQLVCQTALYVLTYLAVSPQGQNMADVALFLSLPILSAMTQGIDAPVCVVFGMTLFYCTRTRLVFLFYLFEVFILIDSVDGLDGMFPVHTIGIAALVVLYVMRRSATRITMDYTPEAPVADVDGAGFSRLSKLGIYGQVAALGAALVVVYLAALLATSTLWRRAPQTSGTITHVTADTGYDAQSDETHASDAQSGGGQANADAAGSATANPTGASTTVDGTPTGSTDGGLRYVFIGILSVFALAFLVVGCTLPFVLPVLSRMRRKRSLEREPLEADRVAGLYQGIIHRLEVAGIVRDDTDTPQEFLMFHKKELADFTASAGLGTDAWTALTDAYEKARYAGLGPSEEELETSWKLYDAIPVCLREAIGWRRYLTGPFRYM